MDCFRARMAKVRTPITSGGTTTRSGTRVSRISGLKQLVSGLFPNGTAFKKYFEEIRLIFSHERMRCGRLPSSARDIYHGREEVCERVEILLQGFRSRAVAAVGKVHHRWMRSVLGSDLSSHSRGAMHLSARGYRAPRELYKGKSYRVQEFQGPLGHP